MILSMVEQNIFFCNQKHKESLGGMSLEVCTTKPKINDDTNNPAISLIVIKMFFCALFIFAAKH
jgi:hypothetical protein